MHETLRWESGMRYQRIRPRSHEAEACQHQGPHISCGLVSRLPLASRKDGYGCLYGPDTCRGTPRVTLTMTLNRADPGDSEHESGPQTDGC
jgi:hypothetical protein